MHSIRTLMDGSIDYAGLFPPALLEMAPTVNNYATYRDHADGWMLSRLIIPVSRLDEFERAANALLPISNDPASDDCWVISALTAPAGEDQFADDLDAIEAFNERHLPPGTGAAVIDTIECRASNGSEIDNALEQLPESIFPYFELDHHVDIRGLLTAIAGMDAGAKIRTGGVTADLHPTPEELARFIIGCSTAEIPFKSTAGLHSPLRHHSDSVGCDQFGFLNVFIGGCLAWWSNGMTEADLVPVLEARSLDLFSIDDEGIGLSGHEISIAQIEEARERFCHGFGSCSFTEPFEDLTTLELLRPDAAAT